MQNLIEPEIKKIKQLIEDNPEMASQFPEGVQDPCIGYCKVMNDFVAWYFLARQRKHTESSILKVAEDGERLQTHLKRIFPSRSGNIYIMLTCPIFDSFNMEQLTFVGFFRSDFQLI